MCQEMIFYNLGDGS